MGIFRNDFKFARAKIYEKTIEELTSFIVNINYPKMQEKMALNTHLTLI